MTLDIASPGQGLIPPSHSGSSLQSESSGTSWLSSSSTSGRKHKLDVPFESSPTAKRRLLAEMNTADASSRHSAPSAQPSLATDGSERRGGGFLRRSETPIQTILSGGEPGNNGESPSSVLYLGFESEERAEDPFCPYPSAYSHQGLDVVRAPGEQQEARKSKGYSFRPFKSLPAGRSATRESSSDEERAKGIMPFPGPESGDRAGRMSEVQPASLTESSPRTELRGVLSAENSDGNGGGQAEARLTLEGTRGGGGEGDRNCDTGDASSPNEEKPITMCGQRLYSDWTGHWGKLSILEAPFSRGTHLTIAPTDGVPCKIPGAGALFPEGYVPRLGDPEPWICPVRDCQTVFADAWALGGHFSVR
jgi:hypothetical protein